MSIEMPNRIALLTPSGGATLKGVSGQSVRSPEGGIAARQSLPADAQASPPEVPGGLHGKARPDLKDAVSELSAHVQSWQRDLKFTVDEDLGRVVVSVVDSRTHEVIRQIPGDEVLAMARFLAESSDGKDMIEGLLLKAHA